MNVRSTRLKMTVDTKNALNANKAEYAIPAMEKRPEPTKPYRVGVVRAGRDS